MPIDWLAIQAEISSDLEAEGVTTPGLIVVDGVIDPINGGDPVPTYYRAMIFSSKYSQALVDGSNILASDRKLLITATGLAIRPKAGMVVILAATETGGVVTPANAERYLIIGNDPHAYDGQTDVFHTVQGRIM